MKSLIIGLGIVLAGFVAYAVPEVRWQFVAFLLVAGMAGTVAAIVAIRREREYVPWAVIACLALAFVWLASSVPMQP